MAPATGTALLVLVAFVLPGFVALWIGERTHVVPVRNRQPFELLLLATYYSVISWGIIALTRGRSASTGLTSGGCTARRA